jgi:GNAT superfamily N-acetyltransferase
MVVIAGATPDRWDDVVTVMGVKGDPARCWCQFFRETNALAKTSTVESRKAALQAQLDAGPPPGVLAYDDAGEPLGWCAVAPRADYARLSRAVIAKATQDETRLWALTCFVVRVGARRQGVSSELLDGAIELARRHGARILEAYPIDLGSRTPSSAELYHGAFHVFRRAGFIEVARPKSDRPTVRLVL